MIDLPYKKEQLQFKFCEAPTIWYTCTQTPTPFLSLAISFNKKIERLALNRRRVECFQIRPFHR